MSPQRNCEDARMSEAELIRAVFPRHTMKLLARLFGVPIDTSRHWLYRHFSVARRPELAVRLLAVMDQQDRRRAVVRRQLEAIAYGEGAKGVGNDSICCACGRHRR